MNSSLLLTAAADELGPGGKRAHPGISATVFEELTECNAALSQQRKKRQVSVTSYVAFASYTSLYVNPYIVSFISILGLL